MRSKPLCLLLTTTLCAGALAAQQSSWSVNTNDTSPGVQLRSDVFGQTALVTQASTDQVPQPSSLGDSNQIVPKGWEALGPFGGDMDAVAVSPTNSSVVLAGLAPSGGFGGTLYRSSDAGASWLEVAALSGTSVHEVVFTPGGVAYIGTIDGVWTSSDDGQSWTQLDLGIGANDQVFEITIDPQDSTRIWAGVADALGSQLQNILLSTDSGATWSDRTPLGGGGLSGRAIAINPTNSNEVIAGFAGGFGGGALWVSSDGGNTWTNRSSGLPGTPVREVEYDGTRILVSGGQLFGSQDFGLYQSTDFGVTWTAIHDGTWPSLVIHDIEIDPAAPNIIYLASAGSGIFRSTDSGTSWTFNLAGALSVNKLHVAGSDVYAASSSVAIWKSADGINWDSSSIGIGSLNLESVAVNPNDASELAAAFQGLNDGGIYTSTDGGLVWDLEPLPGTRFNTVGFSPDGTLYAISDGPTTIGAEALWVRVAGVWSSIGPDQGSLFESELFGLDFSDNDPNLIVTSGADFGVAGFEPTVWVSSDLGLNWSKNYEGPNDFEKVYSVVILPDGTDQTMVGAYIDFGSGQDGGALRSGDGGLTWAEVNTGIALGAQCYSVATSHFDANTVFLSDDDVPTGAIYRSTDGAQTWVNMGYSGRARSVVTSPLRAERIFIGSSDATKVLVSDDQGATTADFDAGLTGAGSVRQLVASTGACNGLLLATTNGAYGEEEGGCQLEADQTSLSLSAGGTVAMDLAAGSGAALQFYAVLGSLSGTTPGTPVGSIVLPLNADTFFLLTIQNANQGEFVNTFGIVDASGRGNASIQVAPGTDPSLAGSTASFAFAVFTIGPLSTFSASNPIDVDLLP